MIDAHCHLVETFTTKIPNESLKTSQLFLMSSKKSEWNLVTEIAQDNRFKAAFGIHPWFAHLHHLDDLKELKSLITGDAFVGEIGLDSIAKDSKGNLYDFDNQLEFFQQQMLIAIDLQVPVSMHAVKVFGNLLPYFKTMDTNCKLNPKSCPPSIMMHSYSGSEEIITQLLKLPNIGPRFYFSFSYTINGRSSKTIKKIKLVPDDRILIESDVHEAGLVDEAMEKAAGMVVKAKKWSLDKVFEKTSENSTRFLTSR